jgi:glucose-6-phosphate isomerase
MFSFPFSSHMITIDSSHLSQIDLAHGLSTAELDSVSDRIPEYLQKIHARNQGFYSDDVLCNDLLEKEIQDFADSVKGKYDHIVLLGIGGSSLGPIALREALSSPFKKEGDTPCQYPKLIVLDNIDPDFLAEAESQIELSRTLFLAVSKSGGTPETVSQYFYFSKKILSVGLNISDHMVFVTDPVKSFLREESEKIGIRMFPIPPNVGGRFSVLTSVGLLPAALLGMDITKLLEGAQKMRESFLSESFNENLPFQLAAMQYLLLKKGKTQNVMYSYSQKLYRVADWFRQLLAESTGKRYAESGEEIFAGITPIAALGATDQHSQNQLYFEGPNDKFFLFLENKSFQTALPIPVPHDDRFAYLKNADFGKLLLLEMEGTKGALTEVNRPHITLSVSNVSEENIGGIFLLLEGATSFLGEFLNINTFDQPGVELSKNITRKLLLESQ